ncbi:hypothetical protein MnTg02_02773 [bacterium MnTg02]|nr:hypothetical protein MnTg02_02773 [bacterium MnTg02]
MRQRDDVRKDRAEKASAIYCLPHHDTLRGRAYDAGLVALAAGELGWAISSGFEVLAFVGGGVVGWHLLWTALEAHPQTSLASAKAVHNRTINRMKRALLRGMPAKGGFHSPAACPKLLPGA